jgi:hypothetical protein
MFIVRTSKPPTRLNRTSLFAELRTRQRSEIGIWLLDPGLHCGKLFGVRFREAYSTWGDEQARPFKGVCKVASPSSIELTIGVQDELPDHILGRVVQWALEDGQDADWKGARLSDG